MNRYGQIKDLLLGDLTLSIFIFGCTVTLLVIISLFLSTKEKFEVTTSNVAYLAALVSVSEEVHRGPKGLKVHLKGSKGAEGSLFKEG